jgi:hypothetical protein
MDKAIHLGPRPGADVNYPRLHVVVTCTHRKRLVVPPRLRLASIKRGGTKARGQEWLARLRAEPAPTLSASDLYAGDHWHVARSLVSQGHPVDLWVASAGYGLLRPSQRLKPYSATFSLGPDSVLVDGRIEQRDAARREWWALITRANLGHGPVRTLRELAASDPRAVLLVALSEPYIRALHDDLVAARAQLQGQGRLLIISAGTKQCQGLDENLLHVSADLQSALGGSRHSLNVRIARYLVAQSAVHRWAMPKADEALRGLVQHSHAPARQRPTRVEDAELIAFMNRARRTEPAIPKSRLLRWLRDSGRSCEQHRFGELFESSLSR